MTSLWVIFMFIRENFIRLHLLAGKSEIFFFKIYVLNRVPIYWQVPPEDGFSYNEDEEKEWMEVIRDAV